MLSNPVDVMLRLVFLFSNPLYGKECILGTTISFFANAALLAPEIAVDGVTLGHFVVAITLRETHFSAIAEFAQGVQNSPLDVGRRPLRGIAEEDFVLDLEAAQVRIEQIQFLVDGHADFSCVQLSGNGLPVGGYGRGRAKVLQAFIGGA